MPGSFFLRRQTYSLALAARASPKQTHLPSVLIAAWFLPCLRGHAGGDRHLFDALGGLVAGFELLEDFRWLGR